VWVKSMPGAMEVLAFLTCQRAAGAVPFYGSVCAVPGSMLVAVLVSQTAGASKPSYVWEYPGQSVIFFLLAYWMIVGSFGALLSGGGERRGEEQCSDYGGPW
jgi:hypothetical protein